MQPKTDLYKKKLNSIILLRGIAIILVVLCHFFNDKTLRSYNATLNIISRTFGHAGVVLFFCISGFVIPFSMFKYDYHIKYFFRFMLRRIIRVEYPYIASIILVLIALFIKNALFKYINFSGNSLDVLTQVFYLNDFLKRPWINIVYWTLALEFQYYLLIGIIFPIIKNRHGSSCVIALLIIALAKFIVRDNIWVLFYFSFFVIGNAFCCYYLRKININQLMLILISCVAINSYHNKLNYWIIDLAVIALFSCFVINDKKIKKSKFLFIGEISYSIYLIHNIVASSLGDVNNLHRKNIFISSIVSILFMAISIFLSYLFYQYIEKKAHEKSIRIKIK